jgi:acetyl esterase
MVGHDGANVPVRIYCPAAAKDKPAIVYIHGGGWVKGGLDESDVFCRHVALATGRVTVSVAYRLSPEARFPAALDDCTAVAAWACAKGGEVGAPVGPVVLAGESAGGNLAAVVCLRSLARADLRISHQILLQPVLDVTLSYPSIDMAADRCLVSRADLTWYYDQCFGGHDARDPMVSPVFATNLAGLPPTLIVAAEYDSLRDEAEAYSGRLRNAGVDTVYTCYPGMIHGFQQMAGLTGQALRAIDEMARFVAA